MRAFAIGLAALLIPAVLLLTGCMRTDVNAMERWAADQRATYPGLTFERTTTELGLVGARIVVAVGSLEEARDLSNSLTEAAAGKSGTYDAMISWPLDGGTVTMF